MGQTRAGFPPFVAARVIGNFQQNIIADVLRHIQDIFVFDLDFRVVILVFDQVREAFQAAHATQTGTERTACR